MALLGFINWLFQFDFNASGDKRATVLAKELSSVGWESFWRVALLTVTCLAIWQLLSSSRFNFLHSSPLEALNAGYYPLFGGEIWSDIQLSLLEVIVGMTLAGSTALLVFQLMRNIAPLRSLLFRSLPFSYISPIVLWLLIFTVFTGSGPHWPSFLHFWHKAIAVGCLTFFPFVQALWGLRKRPWPYRILLAVDDALPIAFVAMCFGELYGASQGLGFMMTVAGATYQYDKELAAFSITVVLLVGLSSSLRLVAKNLCVPEEGRQILPA